MDLLNIFLIIVAFGTVAIIAIWFIGIFTDIFGDNWTVVTTVVIVLYLMFLSIP